MWLNNTKKWMEGLDPSNKTKLLKEAREGATTAHAKFQLRKQQLLEQKKNKLLLKQTEKAAWRPLWLIRLTRPRKTFSSNNWNSKNMFWMPREIQLFFLSRKGRQLTTDELQTNLRLISDIVKYCYWTATPPLTTHRYRHLHQLMTGKHLYFSEAQPGQNT